MTSQIDPTKSYKTYYTKTYLDGIDPAIYTFLVTKGYSNGSETIVAGEYLDGVLLVANQTKPDVVIDAAGDPVCFWGLNGCGGVTPTIAVEDANGNVTVLNGNGNIPLATTGNVGYVSSGELVMPGGAIKRVGTAYVLTPTQTVGATATTNTVTFGIPTLPFNSYLSIRSRQIVATSYAAAGSSHQIRMNTNISSTGPVPVFVITEDKNFGFGPYSGDSATSNYEYSINIPANTPAFTISANFSITILGLAGTTSASGTSGLAVVELSPQTEVIT